MPTPTQSYPLHPSDYKGSRNRPPWHDGGDVPYHRDMEPSSSPDPDPEGAPSGPPLVVLAAGLSRRYGGLKQLEPVGPSGEALLDYGVFDAWRAGASRVVAVVRADLEDRVRKHLVELLGGSMDVSVVLQDPADLPDGCSPPSDLREKPWGTGHALWASREAVGRGPFLLMNADDFYGRQAFESLGEWAERVISSTELAMVPYRLRDSLSEHGGVHRAVCRVNQRGWLEDLEEIFDIHRRDDPPPGEAELEGRTRDGDPVLLEGDRLYSANLWGLTPEVFPLMEEGLRTFLDASGDEPEAEFLIADGLRPGLARADVGIRMLVPGERILGVTHPEDRPAVTSALAGLVEAGVYPRDLRDGFPQEG